MTTAPEVLRRRLAAYRDQTAPLIGYYRLQKVLRTVDGMAPIPDVTAAIDECSRAGRSRQPNQRPRPPKQRQKDRGQAGEAEARRNGTK